MMTTKIFPNQRGNKLVITAKQKNRLKIKIKEDRRRELNPDKEKERPFKLQPKVQANSST